MYSVKEIFYTLQGEGMHAGRPAVFCRFAGCNLWSGRESDRANAVCKFCDTDFIGTDGIGGGKFDSAERLAKAISTNWQPANSTKRKFVVLTGGEPLLQVDDDLINALKQECFEVAVETNGTVLPPKGIDWLCCSPKNGSSLAIESGNELKLVFPQRGPSPHDYEHLKFEHWFIQPMDGPEWKSNCEQAVNFCKSNPRWRLSLQTHKILGIA